MYSIEQGFTVSYSYPVIYTRSVFDAGNMTLRGVLSRSGKGRKKIICVVDGEVARLTPHLLERISRYCEAHAALVELAAPPLILQGGEQCKQDRHGVEAILSMVERHGLCRHSFIIAIGGGAILDLAGYAAATAHRGIRLVRLPTTVLSQNDAGIGVKNGINAFGRKNFIGTFAPPFAVIGDFDFLSTLQPRDLRAGTAEAVKVALVRDGTFFDLLYAERKALAAFVPAAMERMIVRCAELHLQHISGCGDAFESGSSRPLDFGHWSGHKLEELTQGELRHGEAVAIGIALDSLYSMEAGLLKDADLHRVLTLLDDLGFQLYHPALSALDVERSLQEFREHMGGALSIPLISGIGRKVEVSRMDTPTVQRCIVKLERRHARRMAPVPRSEYLEASPS